MNGKGDTPRPMVISRSEWNKNWELAFGKKPEPKQAESKTHKEAEKQNK